MISSLELAKICGVSQGTVDRALHNRKGISEETKKRVLAAARKYGYQPNPMARELMTGESNVIGMLIPQFNRFFLMDLADTVKTYAARQGLRLYLCTVSDKQEALAILGDFSARRSRAVILIPPVNNMTVPAAVTKGMKVITLLNDCSGKNTTFLCPDEFRTGIDAVNILVREGHSEILHLTYDRESYSINARKQGYIDQMKRLSLNPHVIERFSPEEVVPFLRRNKITAVFCHNDWLAYSLLQTAEKNGITVPSQLAILGVDNSPSFTEICPEVSTLEYPFDWLAQEVLHSIMAAEISRPSEAPSFLYIRRRTT